MMARITISKDYGDWAVISSFSKVPGWGPFLYDIAMELATQDGHGLVSDRNEVSSDARRVWEHYFHNRPDVRRSEAIQSYREDDVEYEDEEVLNTAFRKSLDLIPRLKQMNKWIEG